MQAIDKTEAFCFTELKQCIVTISNINGELPAARRRYDRALATDRSKIAETLADLKRLVDRLSNTLLSAAQALAEMDREAMVATTNQFREILLHYDYLGVSSYDSLCSAISSYVERIKPEGDTINKAHLGRLMNRVQMGYYPTDLDHVEYIKRAIVFPETTVNVLDPCCGEGLALSRLVAGQDARSYGVEIDNTRAQEAFGRLTRVGFGSYFFSRISLNAFHCLFLNPPYLSVPCEMGSRRLEKAFLADCLRHLMYGGLLIYIIPGYRLTLDIAYVLTSNFEDLQIYRFLPSIYNEFGQIVVLGKRIPHSVRMDLANQLVQMVVEPKKLPMLDTLPAQSILMPPFPQDISLFKGAEFNMTELILQLHQSKSIKALFQKSALDTRERRPPLPLSISHMGLVGASGHINGYVPGEAPHVIKGRVVRETKSYFNQTAAEMIRTTSNRLIFKILTPNGMKSLT